MQLVTPSVDNRTEHEKAFERWLIAALEHGRAQLAAHRLASPPIAAAPANPSLAILREGNQFR
jgi:hypothetical protein